MTIIEKMLHGIALDQHELMQLAIGYDDLCETEPGQYEEFDIVENGNGRCEKDMQTIIKANDSLWCIPWKWGLNGHQTNGQPYKVNRSVRIGTVTKPSYEKDFGR